ncbi:MAG: hypothetical protein ACRDHE_04825 [Ktedonobacterales bacterium]
MPVANPGGSGTVVNVSSARTALNSQHVAIANHLRELALSIQAVNPDWNGPAHDGFAQFQKAFSQWCEDGAKYFEMIGNKHLRIDAAYQGASQTGSTAITNSAVTG